MLTRAKKQTISIGFGAFIRCLLGLTSLMFAMVSPVWAQSDEAAVSTPDAVESIVSQAIIAEIDPEIIVKLDGETLQSTEVHRDESGALFVNAIPIFTALNNEFEYDEAKKALIVRRSQDGVVMELYTDTGIVKANGKALGKLPSVGEVSADRFILTPNAIAVLSGTNIKWDDERKEFNFELDARLKVATGFEVFVDDISLGPLNPGPKSVGPVLILPLLPVAEALGHDVTVIDGGDVVRVRRAQDSAVLSLNMTTGLVSLRGKPYGITRDISYIDITNLLLPVDAIETLTGTLISSESGSNRIDIRLHDKLQGAVAPSGSVEEIAKNTPFTPERLSFQLGPDIVNTVTGDFRVSQFNGQVRYEIPDLPSNGKEVEPSWLSLDFAHLNGVRGSVGDYAADFRELDGVGIRRIRGASAVKTVGEGRLAVAIGAPESGVKTISDDQSRLTFSGIAGGARYASADGWEAGVSFKKDGLSNDQMAVLSAISGRLGRIKDKKLNWDVRADAGFFNGDAREKSVDMRAQGQLQYDMSPSVTVDAFAQYDGAEFLRSDLDREQQTADITQALDPDAELIDPQEQVSDNRQRGLDFASVGASIRFTPNESIEFLNNPAASVRAQISEAGLLTNNGLGSTSTLIGAGVSSGISDHNVSVAIDGSLYNTDFDTGQQSVSGHQFSVRTYKQFENLSIRGRYQYENQSNRDVDQSASVTVSGYSKNVPLPKDGHLRIAPAGSVVWDGDDVSLRGSLVANFQSGDLLGKKTRLDARVGVLQSFQPNRQNKTDKFLSVTLGRRMRLGDNMAIGLNYRNNLDGDQRVGLVLDGRFDFNDKRRYTNTQDGRGILKGQVFLDQNRDGLRQPGETSLSGAIVRVRAAKLALRADGSGYYTIQNIKEGVYEVQIDGRSLPLGFSQSDDTSLKATIRGGYVTELDIPVVQRGQIRGFAFNDANNNGQYDQGEDRVEGAKIVIKSEGSDEILTSLRSTSFGQYAFDDLPVDRYEIYVSDSEKQGISGVEPVTVELDPSQDLMMKVNVPLQRTNRIRLAQNEEIRPPPEQITMALDPDGPAPP